MRILAVDIGTGTQDILYFDADRPIENCIKLVMPSPTAIAARRIDRASREGRAIALSGWNSGGGPSAWAVDRHLESGGKIFATPQAAETFNDDLRQVEAWGVQLVSDDELRRIDAEHIVLRDLHLEAIATALEAFEEPFAPDGCALACLDHGSAPPDVSDRLFRFDHLRRTLERENDLRAFAMTPDSLPDYLTRARALVALAADIGPVAFMDTGPAAALGVIEDPAVRATEERLVMNLGNMHLLAFHLRGTRVASVMEHHTGEVDATAIERMARGLSDGSLTHDEVFNSQGHGAHHHDRGIVSPRLPGPVVLTGPQRDKIRATGLPQYRAAPHGDMMLSGCFGLLRGYARCYPDAADAIDYRLGAL
jgi:uncharacterized protein (DUF1786 family)